MSPPISPVRRTILLVIASANIVGGVWLLYEQVTVSTIIYGWALFAGGLLVTVGLVLLWEEFIAPLLGRKT
jgi:hypothetical protein